MTYLDVDSGSMRQMEAAHQLLREHQPVITNALRVYAERMTDAAKQAQEAHDAGCSNALVSNQGFAHMAALFTENAERARTVANAIEIWKDGD